MKVQIYPKKDTEIKVGQKCQEKWKLNRVKTKNLNELRKIKYDRTYLRQWGILRGQERIL